MYPWIGLVNHVRTRARGSRPRVRSRCGGRSVRSPAATACRWVGARRVANDPEILREEIDEGKSDEEGGGAPGGAAAGAGPGGVPDPRAREGRWKLSQILRATLLGLMAGCRSLWEADQLTERLAPAMRRRLGLPRRLADTTARDALCCVSLDGLRAVLHRGARRVASQGARAGGAADERGRARRQGDGASVHQRRVRADAAPGAGLAVWHRPDDDVRARLRG